MINEIIKSASIPLAIVVIGLLEWQALLMGVNGALLMTSLTVIGGLAGYKLKQTIEEKKSKIPSDKK